MGALDEAGLLENGVGAFLVHRLEGLARGLDLDGPPKLGNEDLLGVKVGGHGPFHRFGDVTTDAALFLGETGTVDTAADTDAGTSNTADT